MSLEIKRDVTLQTSKMRLRSCLMFEHFSTISFAFGHRHFARLSEKYTSLARSDRIWKYCSEHATLTKSDANIFNITTHRRILLVSLKGVTVRNYASSIMIFNSTKNVLRQFKLHHFMFKYLFWTVLGKLTWSRTKYHCTTREAMSNILSSMVSWKNF